VVFCSCPDTNVCSPDTTFPSGVLGIVYIRAEGSNEWTVIFIG